MLTTLLNFTTSNIYNVSIVEAAIAADTVAANAIFHFAISEAASAVDVVTSRAIFKPAISEAASAADTVTAKAIFKLAISEAVTAVDAVTAKAIFKPAISEAASAVDTVSTRAIFRPAINEAANAADTPSTRAIFRPAISEAASAADNVTASARFKAVLIEAVAATDSVTGIKRFVVSTIDVMAALDAFGASEYAMWERSQFVALQTDYGSSTVDRFFQPVPSVQIDHNQAISFFISVGYQIVPGQVFTATLIRPDGTTFSVNSLRVQPQFSDVYTALGRFHGGTYVFCFLNAGVLNQIGQWSISVVTGTNVSAPACFTVS